MSSTSSDVTWKYSERVPIILDKIASYIAIQPDGEIGFSSFDVYDHIATLVSLTAFSEEIPEEQKSKFMWDAISATFKRKNGRDVRCILLEEIRRQQELYLKQARKEYVLLTSPSICKPGNITRKKIGEHWITFLTLLLVLNIMKPQIVLRPQIFFLIFLAIYMNILNLYYFHNKNYLYLLPIFQILWTNIHGSFIVGIMLAGIYCLISTTQLLWVHRNKINSVFKCFLDTIS